jgi:hypothetical protein
MRVAAELQLAQELPEFIRRDPTELAEIFAVGLTADFREDAAVELVIGSIKN